MIVTTNPVNAVQKLQVTGNVTVEVGTTIFMDDVVSWGDQGDVEFSPKNIDKYGFVYGTVSKSAPGNVAPGSSGYSDYVETAEDGGNGDYSDVITGLTAGITYYMRAYSHNPDGYVYGDEITFETISTIVDDYFVFKSKPDDFYFKSKDTDFVMTQRRT